MKIKVFDNNQQELNTKAASEIIVRQALSELDMWEFETYFTTTNHIDSKGQTIRIIGDFKTIFNSVIKYVKFCNYLCFSKVPTHNCKAL